MNLFTKQTPTKHIIVTFCPSAQLQQCCLETTLVADNVTFAQLGADIFCQQLDFFFSCWQTYATRLSFGLPFFPEEEATTKFNNAGQIVFI